jgi:hypothetical protein
MTDYSFFAGGRRRKACGLSTKMYFQQGGTTR